MTKIKIRYAKKLRILMGGVLFTKAQSLLKYIQAFRKDYFYFGARSKFSTQTYVFMIDGKTCHGGMSDRFRGAMSVYSYCKKYNKQFKICWTYPSELENYLLPASVDWIVKKDELSFNLKDVTVKFFNTYTGLNGKTDEYHQFLKSQKTEIHVYSNVSIEEERYAEYFNELFIPTPYLQEQLNIYKNEIGGKYVSITFRFIGLLGDFKDDERFLTKDTEFDAEYYITKCLESIEKLHVQYSDFRILVTADSPIFLQLAKQIPYVYIIPGDVIHMDNTCDSNFFLHLKTFEDFYMLSMAEKCFSYHIGNMFKNTKFAKTAALVGEKKLIVISE